MPTTINLGQVSAIKVGSIPPSNTKMQWYDTNTNLFKIYDSGLGQWVTNQDLNQYNSALDPNFPLPNKVGGIKAGTLISELNGQTFSQMWDRLIAEEIDPTVLTTKTLSLTENIVPATVEVGTSLQPLLTGTFGKGQIRNGDGTNGPTLVGNPNTYTFTGPGIAGSHVISSVNLSEQYTIPAAIAAVFGNNIWTLQVDHDAGVGAYYTNYGNASNVLDAQRVVGNLVANTVAIVGRRYIFHGVGSRPSNSAEVRLLAGKTFLSATDTTTGIVTITLPDGALDFGFSVPVGKAVQVLLRESSNADITSSLVKTTFNVNDAAGNPISYDTYTPDAGFAGYTGEVHLDITVS